VSRRTAYRYFPAQTKLLTEAALEGLRAPMEAMLAAAPDGSGAYDLEVRVAALIERMQSMAIKHEELLRTMIHQTVLARETTTRPSRGTRRIDWIEAAVESLRTCLSPRAYRRLVSALALCGGIEALLVLRDVRGLSETEAIAVSRWTALAVLRQTVQEAETNKRPTRKGRPSVRMARIKR